MRDTDILYDKEREREYLYIEFADEEEIEGEKDERAQARIMTRTTRRRRSIVFTPLILFFLSIAGVSRMTYGVVDFKSAASTRERVQLHHVHIDKNASAADREYSKQTYILVKAIFDAPLYIIKEEYGESTDDKPPIARLYDDAIHEAENGHRRIHAEDPGEIVVACGDTKYTSWRSTVRRVKTTALDNRGTEPPRILLPIEAYNVADMDMERYVFEMFGNFKTNVLNMILLAPPNSDSAECTLRIFEPPALTRKDTPRWRLCNSDGQPIVFEHSIVIHSSPTRKAVVASLPKRSFHRLTDDERRSVLSSCDEFVNTIEGEVEEGGEDREEEEEEEDPFDLIAIQLKDAALTKIPGLDIILKGIVSTVTAPMTDQLQTIVGGEASDNLNDGIASGSDALAPRIVALTSAQVVYALNGFLVDSVTQQASEDMSREVIDTLSPALATRVHRLMMPKLQFALARTIGDTVVEHVNTHVVRKVARELQLSLTDTLTRSVTHSVVPTLTLALQSTRDNSCVACFESATNCDDCPYSTKSMMQANYYAGYYVDWYSEYYGKYYGQAVRSVNKDRHEKYFTRIQGTDDPSMVKEEPGGKTEAMPYYGGAFSKE